MFCLKEGIVRPTSERIKMESQATARDFLHLLVLSMCFMELWTCSCLDFPGSTTILDDLLKVSKKELCYWVVVNQNKQMLMEDREKTLNLLINLGFIVNLEKSNLIPTQTITYIGAMFCLKEGIVRPTSERITQLNGCSELSRVQLSLNTLL
jgi:hypothetical protein